MRLSNDTWRLVIGGTGIVLFPVGGVMHLVAVIDSPAYGLVAAASLAFLAYGIRPATRMHRAGLHTKRERASSPRSPVTSFADAIQ